MKFLLFFFMFSWFSVSIVSILQLLFLFDHAAKAQEISQYHKALRTKRGICASIELLVFYVAFMVVLLPYLRPLTGLAGFLLFVVLSVNF